MVSLKKSRRVRPKLFKLLLEELLLVVGDGLFVQNQNLRNIVVVYLCVQLIRFKSEEQLIHSPSP